MAAQWFEEEGALSEVWSKYAEMTSKELLNEILKDLFGLIEENDLDHNG